MSDPLSVAANTSRYLERYPEETERLKPFLSFLQETNPTKYALRSHSIGHVTTSGFLVSQSSGAVLLIYHLKLQRYLQPGGHVEEDKSLLASALREIREEVGISGSGLILCQPDNCPIDIDPHRIPADSRRNLPEHWHFDFRYLFKVTSEAEAAVVHQAEEVAHAEWFSWDSDLSEDCCRQMLCLGYGLELKVKLLLRKRVTATRISPSGCCFVRR